jgi:esterase/lipase superfamily enzyme
MHVEHHYWNSSHLGRDMALTVYGHWGQPVVVFPSSRGRYFDYEGMGMIGAIADFIDRGRVKLFCIDSVDADTWYDFAAAPSVRNARHNAYDRYVVDEVVPFVRSHCRQPDERIMTNGCSMGAFHAVNFFLRHPDRFAGCIALSGLYRLDRTEFGLTAENMVDVYFNSPIHYLAQMSDPWYLDRYRDSTIVVCTGQGAWEAEAVADTRSLAAIFQSRDIPAWVDFWGYDVNHDWPWWFRQMRYFLDRLYGSGG